MNYLYVDNSNVWIEGMHVSAVHHGLAPNIWTAQQEKICDYQWKLDFGKLYQFAGGQASEVGRAVLFGSRPPENDSLWAMAQARGFQTVVYDRNFNNKEKKVDTSIVTEIMSDAASAIRPESDEITLVAGDADYVPAIENLRRRGFTFHVMFWKHAARELRDAASKFFPMDDYLDHLRF
jgi:uncharacterized LabA/DUF88 family protein